MGWQGRSGSGRREFGRVVLTSLAAGARAELEERRSRGQRLRARRALRRLEELEQALEQLEQGSPPLHPPWLARRGTLALTTAVWLAALGALAVAVAVRGAAGPLVAVLDVAMLVGTLAWFCAVVARTGPHAGGKVPPPKEGSSADDPGR